MLKYQSKTKTMLSLLQSAYPEDVHTGTLVCTRMFKQKKERMQIHVIYPFSTLNTSFPQSFCIKSNKNTSSNTDVTVFTKGLTKWLQLKNFKSLTYFFWNMKLIKLSVTLFCYCGLIMHFILLQMIVAPFLWFLGWKYGLRQT